MCVCVCVGGIQTRAQATTSDKPFISTLPRYSKTFYSKNLSFDCLSSAAKHTSSTRTFGSAIQSNSLNHFVFAGRIHTPFIHSFCTPNLISVATSQCDGIQRLKANGKKTPNKIATSSQHSLHLCYFKAGFDGGDGDRQHFQSICFWASRECSPSQCDPVLA